MLRRATGIALGVLAPAPAWAAGEGLAASPVWHVINFALFVAVLIYFARTPVRSFFAGRRRDIEQDLHGAQQTLGDAERRLEECQRRLEALDRELEGLRSAVRAQAEAERRHILEDAKEGAERVRRDAAAVIEYEVQRARDSLRREAVELAVGRAEELLQREVGDPDRERLLDDFVRRVESAGVGAGTRV